jgi:hypothetical protein
MAVNFAKLPELLRGLDDVAARTLHDTPRKCPLNPLIPEVSLQYTV